MSFLAKLTRRIQKDDRDLDGQAYLDRAVARWHRGDLSAALDDLDMAIRLLPEGPDRIAAYANRARVHRNLEHWAEAMADLDYVQKEAPTLGSTYADRAFVLLMQEDHQAALVELDRAIALLPAGVDQAMAYANRGSTKETLGDLSGALADYDRAIASGPEFQPAYQQRDAVRKLLADGAKPSVETTEDPATVAAELLQHASACEQRRDLIDALAVLTRILELRPRDPSILYRRGVLYCKLRLTEQALDDLDWAVSLHPRFPAAITEHGLALAHLGNLEGALYDVDQALALDPGYAIAHQNRAFVHALAGRWPEALASADMAVRLEPGNLDYRAARGEVHAKLGHYDQAYRDLQAYLHAQPEGPKADGVRHVLSELPAVAAEQAEQDTTWPPEALWHEHVVLEGPTTVEEMLRQVQKRGAYYGILPLPDEQWAVMSVYGQGGLRDRLTAIADVIGRKILAMRLEQFMDIWHPCVPVPSGSSREAAWEACAQSGGRTLVWEGTEISGVLEARPNQIYPGLPTALFGPTPAFDREEQQDQHHGCQRCRATFAYYVPVLEGDLLVDYACPYCGASPISGWIEERMRPGRWSQEGFLAPDEALLEVIAADEETLDQLGATHEQIAAALEALLADAVAAYQDEFAEARASFNAHLVASKTHALDTVAKPPMHYDLADVEAQLRQGQLPPESAGARVDAFQVFLQPYLGYQYCPFTILCRPWSEDVPTTPIKAVSVDQATVLTLQTGMVLPCQAGQTYRYSDMDFMVVNRGTGDYLAGPGLIVHLIRDHHFFEGPGSPYRVDPVKAAQVLGLQPAT